MEEHNIICSRRDCEAVLGPCEEFGCVNRYNHDGGGFCELHRAQEQRNEWEEQ